MAAGITVLAAGGTIGDGTTPRYEGLSEILDRVFGKLQGTVIYRGPNGWEELLATQVLDALSLQNTPGSVLIRGNNNWGASLPQTQGITTFALTPVNGGPSTSGGGIGSWQPIPSLDGDAFILNCFVYAQQNSAGAASISVGTAISSTTSASNLINAQSVHGLSTPTGILSTSGATPVFMPSGDFITVTGSADTTNFAGILVVEYIIPQPPSF
jgi:hypothetical protein